MMQVSVVICTYNRSKVLKECIESVLNNRYKSALYEVLVIDNNSTDDTKDIVLNLQKLHTNIRYVKEEVVGLSHARNRGIHESKGEIVAFIDDDVEVNPNYIEAIVSFFSTNIDEVCVSGKVIPVWEFPKPSWFSNEFASIIGETTYGNEQRILHFREYPIGCNMIFKKSIFNEIGLFNTDLGIKGDKLYLGEEVEICDRILKLGKDIYYVPEASVHHKVHKNKVDQLYIEKRLSLEGDSIAQWHYDTKNKLGMFYSYLVRLGVLILRDYPLYLINKSNQDVVFSKRCKIKRTKAYLKKSRSLIIQ